MSTKKTATTKPEVKIVHLRHAKNGKWAVIRNPKLYGPANRALPTQFATEKGAATAAAKAGLKVAS